MNMRFEITVSDAIVVVNVIDGRDRVRVFINDDEQEATKVSCKF